jgi:hypothetical protein
MKELVFYDNVNKGVNSKCSRLLYLLSYRLGSASWGELSPWAKAVTPVLPLARSPPLTKAGPAPCNSRPHAVEVAGQGGDEGGRRQAAHGELPIYR